MSHSSINEDIDRLTKRAERICPEYDPQNVFWKQVDDLFIEQGVIRGKINKMANNISQATTQPRVAMLPKANLNNNFIGTLNASSTGETTGYGEIKIDES